MIGKTELQGYCVTPLGFLTHPRTILSKFNTDKPHRGPPLVLNEVMHLVENLVLSSKRCSHINNAAAVDLRNEGEGQVVDVLHDRGGVGSLRHQTLRTCVLQ